MLGVAIVICVALLVATVFVRGYTMKTLNRVRFECGSLINEEKRLRRDLEKVEILEESAEARRNQTQGDIEKFEREISELTPSIAHLEAELSRDPEDD